MKPFTTIAIVIFSFIAIGHLIRMFFGWEVMINDIHIPLWVSGIAVIIFVELAYMLWRESQQRK
jgi:sterol desaturase/sphingolipid hydroxylase (fatty acid hydroxylase superfamily)